MAFISILCVCFVIYSGMTEKRKGNKEAIEYERKQNELLGLEPRSVRLEKMCPTKKKDFWHSRKGELKWIT